MHELLQEVLESISKSEGAWALSLFFGKFHSEIKFVKIMFYK